MKETKLPFSIYTCDNFDYGGKSLFDGNFATEREALAKARDIIDKSLMSLHKPGESYQDLYTSFLCHGEVPMINGPEKGNFDAYAYVRQQCAFITSLSAAEAH